MRNGRQIKAGRPKPTAHGHPSTVADFCNKIGHLLTQVAPQRMTRLFDHLVRAGEQRVGHRKTECLCSP